MLPVHRRRGLSCSRERSESRWRLRECLRDRQRREWSHSPSKRLLFYLTFVDSLVPCSKENKHGKWFLSRPHYLRSKTHHAVSQFRIQSPNQVLSLCRVPQQRRKARTNPLLLWHPYPCRCRRSQSSRHDPGLLRSYGDRI